MTKQQLQSFLNDAGVAYSSPADNPTVVEFNNRGNYVRSVTYETGDLLQMSRWAPMPKNKPDLIRILEIFQALEDEYPIVKLIYDQIKDETSFAVSAEQFEPLTAIGDVFWRTADLVVSVAEDGCRRLNQQIAAEISDDSHDAWVAQLEGALKRGSVNEALDSSTVFAAVKNSLAMVLTDGGNASAFCVASDAQASYYVTNAHVVKDANEIFVYRQRPRFEKMIGNVVAEGKPDETDLAIIKVDVPGIASLKLQDALPKDETPIGVAGYPRAQVQFAKVSGELVPAIHLGTITAVVEGGAGILHDALSRPGSSGGPVFDISSGEVIGVHSAGWAEEEQFYCVGSAAALMPFLATNNITINNQLP